MAGLANFALLPSDTQSANSGLPTSGNRDRGPKFRLDDKSTTVFDAVLNNRQPAPERRPAREAIEPGSRKSPVADRNPASARKTQATSAPVERTDPPAKARRSEPDRQAAATDNGKRPSNLSMPEARRESGKSAETENVTEDKVVEDSAIGEVQIDPSISEVGDIAQENPQSADGTETDQDDFASITNPPGTDENMDEGETGAEAKPEVNIGRSADPTRQGEEIPGGFLPDGEVAEAGTGQTGVETEQTGVEDDAVATPGLAAKDATVDLAARQATPAVDAVANTAKKGAGAIVPDADATTANPDGNADDGETSAPKARTPDVSAAKAEGASPKPSNASFAAELGQTSRTTSSSSQTPQGNASAPQIDTAAAVFRASTPAAKGSIPNLPVRAIALHIANKAADGITKFQIRLDPPDLGRIDVKLEIGRDGRVSAQLTVDRPETLDALLRDQRGLERTLQNAGLDTSEDGLSFNLRQDTEAGAGGNERNDKTANPQNRTLADMTDTPELQGRPQFIGLSAVDIRV